MELSKVIEKCLKMIEQYCRTHDCSKDCKLVRDAYMGCPFHCPSKWAFERLDLSQLENANNKLDMFDLYDFFDEEIEE